MSILYQRLVWFHLFSLLILGPWLRAGLIKGARKRSATTGRWRREQKKKKTRASDETRRRRRWEDEQDERGKKCIFTWSHDRPRNLIPRDRPQRRGNEATRKNNSPHVARLTSSSSSSTSLSSLSSCLRVPTLWNSIEETSVRLSPRSRETIAAKKAIDALHTWRNGHVLEPPLADPVFLLPPPFSFLFPARPFNRPVNTNTMGNRCIAVNMQHAGTSYASLFLLTRKWCYKSPYHGLPPVNLWPDSWWFCIVINRPCVHGWSRWYLFRIRILHVAFTSKPFLFNYPTCRFADWITRRLRFYLCPGFRETRV